MSAFIWRIVFSYTAKTDALIPDRTLQVWANIPKKIIKQTENVLDSPSPTCWWSLMSSRLRWRDPHVGHSSDVRTLQLPKVLTSDIVDKMADILRMGFSENRTLFVPPPVGASTSGVASLAKRLKYCLKKDNDFRRSRHIGSFPDSGIQMTSDRRGRSGRAPGCMEHRWPGKEKVDRSVISRYYPRNKPATRLWCKTAGVILYSILNG